jgi:hypothetical protein
MMSRNTEPKWSGEKALFLSFAGRRIYIAGRKMTERYGDVHLETLSVNIPKSV